MRRARRSVPPSRGGEGRASAARCATVRALVAVEDGQPVDEALAAFAPPAGSDRGMAWHLTLGVLRHRASVDASLRPWLRQDLDSMDPLVRAVLRMAAFERVHGGTQAHAAVDQAVETARAVGAGRASGLVNAVARRIRTPDVLTDAERWEHPVWLVERWLDRYGREATERWCQANQLTPPLCLVARDDPGGLAERLRAEGLTLRAATAGGQPVDGVWRVEGHRGALDGIPGFHEGAFWVQDAASASMVDLVPSQARRVLDACAAPGGKSLRLASRGHEVTAVDQSADRLDRMRDSLQRTGLAATIHVHDWTTGPREELGTFDAVLVDAPCTGLGTLRRRPDIRWRRTAEDVPASAERQARILRATANHVRPGGWMVWVVCSPEPEEGVELVRAFVAEHPEWTIEQTRVTAPPQDDEDAFQGVRLRKQGEPE